MDGFIVRVEYLGPEGDKLLVFERGGMVKDRAFKALEEARELMDKV